MCFPALAAIPAAFAGISSAMGTIGTVASLAGTGLSAVGAIQQGNAAKASADAQAALDTQQATMTTLQGEYQAQRQQAKVNQVTGSQIAGVSGSGVDLTGSPSDVIASSASQGALDVEAIRYGAKVNSNNLMYQADVARQGGSAAQTAGYLGAAGGALGGLARLGTQLGRPYGRNGLMMDYQNA